MPHRPGDLGLIPRTHIERKRENGFHSAGLCPATCMPWHARPCTQSIWNKNLVINISMSVVGKLNTQARKVENTSYPFTRNLDKRKFKQFRI